MSRTKHSYSLNQRDLISDYAMQKLAANVALHVSQEGPYIQRKWSPAKFTHNVDLTL